MPTYIIESPPPASAGELYHALDELYDLAFGFNVSGVYFHEDPYNAEVLNRVAEMLDRGKPG